MVGCKNEVSEWQADVGNEESALVLYTASHPPPPEQCLIYVLSPLEKPATGRWGEGVNSLTANALSKPSLYLKVYIHYWTEIKGGGITPDKIPLQLRPYPFNGTFSKDEQFSKIHFHGNANILAQITL